MLHFYSPCKSQKTNRFLTFSGGTEINHWAKKGLNEIRFTKDPLRTASCTLIKPKRGIYLRKKIKIVKIVNKKPITISERSSIIDV